jgi:ATP phosphoribosyltransferase
MLALSEPLPSPERPGILPERGRLKLAIQKSGRLSEKSLAMIEAAGISFSRNKLKLKSSAHNFPLDILFLRDDDIPSCVANGAADIGIVGENEVGESGEDVQLVDRLGFARCRLSIAVPKPFDYQGPASLQGKRIATSYPHLLSQYLQQQGVEASIYEISGSVEIAPGVDLADAICDLVSTGSTLASNGLKEAEVILRSEALLIGRPGLSSEKQNILNNLRFRLHALLRAKNHKYIMFNVPDEAIEQVVNILPGLKSPSRIPLVREGWSSLHTVVEEDFFWDIIEQLKAAGAEGILVSPIEKMIL